MVESHILDHRSEIGPTLTLLNESTMDNVLVECTLFGKYKTSHRLIIIEFLVGAYSLLILLCMFHLMYVRVHTSTVFIYSGILRRT